jgi:hypothetical protein
MNAVVASITLAVDALTESATITVARLRVLGRQGHAPTITQSNISVNNNASPGRKKTPVRGVSIDDLSDQDVTDVIQRWSVDATREA